MHFNVIHSKSLVANYYVGVICVLYNTKESIASGMYAKDLTLWTWLAPTQQILYIPGLGTREFNT